MNRATSTFFRRRYVHYAFSIVMGFVVALNLNVAANAQDIQHTTDSVDKTRRSTLTVDPSSLGLNLQIPLADYAGRAGLNLPIALQYSSKVWHMEYGGNAGLSPHANGWVFPVFDQTGGWSSTLAVPTLRSADTERPYTSAGVPAIDGQYIVYGIVVQMPDGSSHQMRRDDYAHQVDANHPYNPDGTYYAIDGSHLRVEYHTGTNAPPNVLYLPDGAKYTFGLDGSGFSMVTLADRNGNTLTYSKSQTGQYQWTDTLGRTFGLLMPSNPAAGDTTYVLPGLANTPITYTLRWKNLADARSDPNQPLRYAAHYNDCDMSTATVHSTSLFGTGTSCDGDDFPNQLFNPVLLSEVVLPNGKSYKFTYNVFGELDKIAYPTGGYERFAHDTIPAISYMRNFYLQGNRGVTDHWISVDGTGTDENDHHWHYQVTYPNNTPPYIVTATAPDGTYTERYLYSSQNRAPFTLEDVKLGKAYEERDFSSTGQMLRRKLTDWMVTEPPSGGHGERNPRIVKQVEVLLDTGADALVKTTVFGYDTSYEFTTGVEQTSVAQYDFASVDQTTAQTAAISAMPQPSTAVRTTETDYLDGNANYRDRNLIGLVSATRIRDVTSTIVAQSSLSYDEAAFPLLTYGTVTSWSDPGTNVRGNVTTASRWLKSTNTWLQTHSQFDQCGSLRKTWDARDPQLLNPTEVQYSATYQYAFPTLTISADPDLTPEANGPLAPLTTQVAYDLSTGLLVSRTDPNSAVSQPEYSDVLLRPTREIGASGNVAQTQGIIQYDDTNRVVTGKGDLRSFNDNTLKNKMFYDGVGRTTEVRTYEDDTNYIAVRTEYDAMGRAYKVSNPFHPLQSETPVWTISEFDGLGRVKKVTSPGGAVVTTAYAGNAVTVTDAVGRKRRSVTDALGRAVRVDEPDGNGSLDVNGAPAQSTSYSYDALDNLTQVVQGTQTRTFVYDSLKRLVSATNPESGTVSYQYDPNGNLTSKTDARSITTTYAYDALNRNISVSYTNDPANTPAVTRTYDNPTSGANGLGRLWKIETTGTARITFDSYDALGHPTSQSQQFYINNAWSQSFTVSAVYDKAGHVLTLTYPSGHAVNYNYDSGGRLADKDAQNLAFTGNLGDGQNRNYSTGISYSAFGAPTQEKFGTDIALFNKRHYNVRGQLYDVRVSTQPWTSDQWNWDRGAIINYYSTADFNASNDARANSGPDNNGNLLRQDNWVPTNYPTDFSYFRQNYTYDTLNRLKSVAEYLNGTTQTFAQTYSYDRYGNRTIDGANTWGGGINYKQFSVDPATNRLGVPSGQAGTMQYDFAGNLDVDTYSGLAVGRVYDAENRLKSETQANNYLAGSYTYDGDGKRIKRIVGGVETWQVYGLGGELLAEYAANAAASSPQKEYGYRNGELLVTADAPPPQTSTQNVIWTNAGGVSISGNSLSKTAAEGWGNAGAASQQRIVSGDGYVEFTAGNNTTWWMCGLSHTNPDWGWSSIDYALFPTNWGHFYIYEKGVYLGDFGPYAAGDVLRVAIEGGVVKYRKNGALVYTSTAAPVYPLLVDTTFYSVGSTLNNAVISGNLGASPASIHWLVTDQLGTPRMIFDQSGTLTVTNQNGQYVSGATRHDYLPFGEEVFAGTGGRTTQQGYVATDGVREKFTGYEADTETGLNFAQARYQSPVQGRFTSVDPLGASALKTRPQTWNRYSCVNNNPLNHVDPSGMMEGMSRSFSTGGESFYGVSADFLGVGEQSNPVDWDHYDYLDDQRVQLSDEIVELIECAFGPGAFKLPSGREVVISNTGTIPADVREAATKLANEQFTIGADKQARELTGVDPGTSEQQKSTETTSPSAQTGVIGRVPSGSVSSGGETTRESTTTNPSIEVRQARLLSTQIKTIAALADKIHNTPLRTASGASVRIDREYAVRQLGIIFDLARAHAAIQAAMTRPLVIR
jgi:RHS repeat-associated protein